MKQFFSYLGASLAAIAALASCNKEIDAPIEDLKGGVPFEICASTTKTAIDGTFKTTWVVGETPDSINVYHKLASAAAYTHDGKFLAKTEEGKFSGTLAAAPEAGEEYQWLAHYPYNSYLTTPAEGYSYIGSRSDASQSQEGLNSVAHLCGKSMPLVGKGTSTGTASPTINMVHASSVLEINVTNKTTEALDVTSIAFTAPESIIGQFVIDYTGKTTIYTAWDYVSATATLSVTDGTIAAGESGKFYLAIKPFSATSEQTLKVSVNGYEKEIKHSGDVTFTAGKIKKVNFDVDKVIVDYVTLPWTEDFTVDRGIYALVNGGTTTMIKDEKLAGGTIPELLVSKENGSFSAKVKATAGDYVLTFKSNHPDYLVISVDNDKITLLKVSDTEYKLTIPSGVEFFNLTFTNTNSKNNTRLDDISLKADKRTVLSTPDVIAYLNSKVNNSIDVAWDKVDNAGSYVVTATPAEGSVVSNTVLSDGSETYDYTITGLAYETEYTISVVAKSSNTDLYKDSEAGEYSEKVKTGVKPSTGEDPKEQIVFLETFGSNSSNTAVASYTGYSATANMFTTSGDVKTHYSGSGSVGKNNLSSSNLSSGYTGASGLSGCYHAGTANTEKTILQISNIDITDCTDISISFGALGGSTSHKINVFYKIDDGAETALITNGALTNANWTLLSGKVSETGKSLTLIFKHTPTKQWTIRMDDIKVVGTK